MTLTTSGTGVRLLTELSIPESDVLRLPQGIVAVRRVWEAAITAWLVDNRQEVYRNWWQDAQLVTAYGVNDVDYAYIINGWTPSTMLSFSSKSVATHQIDRFDSYHQGYFDTGTISANMYERINLYTGSLTGEYYYDAAEMTITSTTNKFGETFIGAFVEHRFSLGKFDTGLIGMSSGSPGSVEFKRIVKDSPGETVIRPKLDNDVEGWRVIVGPSVCTRAEFHPEYWWVVADTMKIAQRMKNMRKYIADRNERARVDDQIARIEARGADLMGYGVYSANLDPYKMYPPTRGYADLCRAAREVQDGVDWAKVNFNLDTQAGRAFPFQINVRDELDSTMGLVSGNGAVTLTVRAGGVESSTGDTHDASLWQTLINGLMVVGRPVTVVDGGGDAEVFRSLSVAASGSNSNANYVGTSWEDAGFFGLGAIQQAIRPASNSQSSFARLLLDPGGLTSLEVVG